MVRAHTVLGAVLRENHKSDWGSGGCQQREVTVRNSRLREGFVGLAQAEA